VDSRARKLLAFLGALVVSGLAAGAPALAATGNVTISDSKFTPEVITINLGDKVKWSYPTGATTHTATARSGQGVAFDSGNMVMGDTYTSPAFSKAGTFIYYCKIHGTPSGKYADCGMCGKVTVKAPTPPPPTVPPKTPTPSPRRTATPTTAPVVTARPVTTFATSTSTPSPSPSPTPTMKPKPTATLAFPSFSPVSSTVAFGTPENSSRGPLLGIAIAATGIAIGGGILVWYRLRGPA
jgi:plastocyanin